MRRFLKRSYSPKVTASIAGTWKPPPPTPSAVSTQRIHRVRAAESSWQRQEGDSTHAYVEAAKADSILTLGALLPFSLQNKWYTKFRWTQGLWPWLRKEKSNQIAILVISTMWPKTFNQALSMSSSKTAWGITGTYEAEGNWFVLSFLIMLLQFFFPLKVSLYQDLEI